MLSNKLPKMINPIELCKNAQADGYHLTGQLFIRDLINIDPEIKKQGDTLVHISLFFTVDAEGYCCIQGEISVKLQLQCVRCLEPVVYDIIAPILVSPVVSDTAAKQLPEQFEPLMVTDGEVNLSEWIAEELHLALPFVPCHESECVSYNTSIE